MFFLAESLGKTIPELLSGRPTEMTTQEYAYWVAYFKEKVRVEEEASKKARKSGTADRQFKRTMGSQQ